jgi:FAD/FMN-containing dehydrogenase
MGVIEAIKAVVGAGAVFEGEAIEATYLSDWVVPMTDGRPLGLVKPATTVEVAAVMRVAHEAAIPVVVQGGRTGLAGGATPVDGGLVLSLERMSGVEEVDGAASTMTVLAGTPLQTVQEAASDAGLYFGLDMGARGTSQVGGMVATNAGGNRVIRFGMMRDLVLGLEVVLADGTVITALNKLIKNNAGYDVRQYFIGSEGTLGIVTRAVLKLHPEPRSVSTAFCSVASYDQVIGLLQHARAWLAGSLSAFELMWGDYYTLMTAEGGAPAPLPAGSTAYLLIEALGTDPGADPQRFDEMLEAAAGKGLIDDAAVAHSAREAAAFWQVRDSSAEFARLGWPALGYDIGIPTRDIGRFIEACRARLQAAWPGSQTAFFGHIGDSNLHLHVKTPPAIPMREVTDLVYGLVAEWHGTTSAEHGIGTLRRPYLGYTRTEAELSVMRRIKAALDPKGILNPGKILDGDPGD